MISEELWKKCKVEALAIMINAAKKEDIITYSDFVADFASYKFSGPRDQLLFRLLTEVAKDENSEGRGLLSVVVVLKIGEVPSDGFFTAAREVGRIFNNERTFFEEERQKVYRVWAKTP